MKMHFKKKKQYLTAACIYLGQMTNGYMLGWTAPILQKLQDPEQTPLEDVLTDQQSALVGSIFFVGAIIGPYISAHLSNQIGRKPCIFAAGMITMLSAVLLALAKSVALIYTGRVFAGAGGSVLLVMSLVYTGEIASTNIRGILLTLLGLSGSSGILLAYVVGPYVSYSAASWVAVAMFALYITGLYFIPESPVFQVMIDKKEEAIKNLKSLGRENEINVVLLLQEESKSKLTLLTDMFTIKSNRKAFFILLSLFSLQQLSGHFAMIMFSTTIFEMSGSNIPSHVSTIILGVTQVVSAVTTPLFVENVGRKRLLIFSSGISSLSLTALATYFYLYDISHPAAASLQWMSLTSLIVYCLAYTVGLSVIPDSLAGEMFTTNLRSIGTTVTLTISWAFSFAVSTAFGYMVPAWGAAVTFWIYAGACAIAFVFTIVFVPETKGKTLFEVQEMLNK